MQHIIATEPVPAWDWKSLEKMQKELREECPVIISIDFENVDHIGGKGISHVEKMSELGVAVYDFRTLEDVKTDSATCSNSELESCAKGVVADHVITTEFENITEKTCTASYHRSAHKDPKRAHRARPYHCRC